MCKSGAPSNGLIASHQEDGCHFESGECNVLPCQDNLAIDAVSAPVQFVDEIGVDVEAHASLPSISISPGYTRVKPSPTSRIKTRVPALWVQLTGGKRDHEE
jgi:hypothetical protein